MTARHIRIAGFVILIAGLGAAPVIYFTARVEERQAILGIDIRTNRQRGQLERMGGKNYVLLSDLDEWFTSLWHGRRLGVTVGVLSVVGFLLCRGLARVQEDHEKELAGGVSAPSPRPLPQPDTTTDSADDAAH